jgi:hypothetical protein
MTLTRRLALVRGASPNEGPNMTQLAHSPKRISTPFEKTLDTKTVEVLALSVFRTLFRDGLHLPLKKEGLMDMDLVVKDNNVLLNMNTFQSEVPELSIWRITFAYRDKPVVEYGRGIKNDMKIHLPQLFVLLIAIWREKRKKLRARARGEIDREDVLLTMSASASTHESLGEASS